MSTKSKGLSKGALAAIIVSIIVVVGGGITVGILFATGVIGSKKDASPAPPAQTQVQTTVPPAQASAPPTQPTLLPPPPAQPIILPGSATVPVVGATDKPLMYGDYIKFENQSNPSRFPFLSTCQTITDTNCLSTTTTDATGKITKVPGPTTINVSLRSDTYKDSATKSSIWRILGSNPGDDKTDKPITVKYGDIVRVAQYKNDVNLDMGSCKEIEFTPSDLICSTFALNVICIKDGVKQFGPNFLWKLEKWKSGGDTDVTADEKMKGSPILYSDFNKGKRGILLLTNQNPRYSGRYLNSCGWYPGTSSNLDECGQNVTCGDFINSVPKSVHWRILPVTTEELQTAEIIASDG